ncbi:MAG: hypothetical protein D4R64_08350 [Porphyromonadaceae bacterium]|nr:MAG: hypothetical protein D4R64_08350 [Porphyromonadaceae bacterium]
MDLPDQCNITKSQILRDTSVDLTKYHLLGSQPGMASFIRVCDYLKLCPGIVTLFACWVNQQIITYPQALQILLHWPEYEHLLDGFQYGVIKLLGNNNLLPNPSKTPLSLTRE